MCTRSRGNSKSHGTSGPRAGFEPSSLMSFCAAVTRSTSVYDSSATFFEPLSAITVARELPRLAHKFCFHLARGTETTRAIRVLGSSISSFVHLLRLFSFFAAVFPIFPVCIGSQFAEAAAVGSVDSFL